MPSYETIENGLIAELIADTTYFTSANLIAGGFDEVVRWLLDDTTRIYGGYTLLAGGNKAPTPHVWTWHIRLALLIRVANDALSLGQQRLKNLLNEIDVDEWRRKRTKLNGTALRSAVASIGEPVLMSYNQTLFYRLEMIVDADVRYLDVI